MIEKESDEINAAWQEMEANNGQVRVCGVYGANVCGASSGSQ